MIKNLKHEYKHDNVVLEGYCAYTDDGKKKPAILIVHDWSGRNEFAHKKAEKLAEMGFVGFALDMFGKGKQGNTKEEKIALIQPLMQNRKLLQERILAAFNTVQNFEFVDKDQIGAIGFCFGGLCVLDLARSGADVKAVVSFHGLLSASDQKQQAIKAKILALHGFDDPMVTPENVIEFCKEMTQAKANWEMDMYGHTMHAFTNPQANDPGFGTVYNQQAESRSWIRMHEFFKEVFRI